MELIKGYDCPDEAKYLDVEVHGEHGTTRMKNAICVFEQDLGKPLTRLSFHFP
jgi:primary-amine oxidase